LLYPSLDGGRWVIVVFATMRRGTKWVENTGLDASVKTSDVWTHSPQ